MYRDECVVVSVYTVHIQVQVLEILKKLSNVVLSVELLRIAV